MSDDLTIDELARQIGTRTSTVRMYQTRGLLPAPEIRGRVGYYSSAHLARLRIIDRLQKRGFSLAAIKDLLENWSRGGSLSDVLNADQELATFGDAAELSEADFAALFPDGKVDPEVVRRSAAIGLIAFDAQGGTMRAPSQVFLEIGRELAARQIPPTRALKEFEQLSADANRIAERFIALFDEFGTDQAPPEQRAALRAGERRVRGMAAAAVKELVFQALEDAAARRPEPDPGAIT